MKGPIKFASPLLDEATVEAAADVLRSGHITSGVWVERFEAALSEFCGARPVRVVTSATAAMEIALQLCGIGRGDEVITCAQSFFAVPNMIVKQGATPVFVDCDPLTRNIDLAAVAARIGPRTRAIMPTHWPGSLVDLDALYALARDRKLRVIEDAALVMGSTFNGRPIGAIGDLVSFSFHPNKNMTSIEGGALVVNDADEAKRVEVLRFHGIERLADGTRDVGFPGGKFNLPDVNARIGLAQLDVLDSENARRAEIAASYRAGLSSVGGITLMPQSPDRASSFHLFPVLVDGREAFLARMKEAGIGIGVHYRRNDEYPMYRKSHLPNAEWFSERVVSLPMHLCLTDDDVAYVTSTIASGW